MRLTAEQAESLFERFDTDQNGKVDALEVMGAQVRPINLLTQKLYSYSRSDIISLVRFTKVQKVSDIAFVVTVKVAVSHGCLDQPQSSDQI